jgi:hypothetical protein
MAEAEVDYIEILEGLIFLDPSNLIGQTDVLRSEITRKKALLKKRNPKMEKPHRIEKVADELGRKDEHKSLFKLFSKLLHPTSYLVNSSLEKTQNQEIRNMLVIHIQLYAWDIVDNIRQVIGLPQT